jgi:hypothetical protein
MTTKIAAIQKQLEKAGAASSKAAPAPVVSLLPAANAAPVAENSASKGKTVAPSRIGKVHLGAYLSPDFKRSLMLVRAQTGKTETQLLADALNDLFRAHNVPVIDSKSNM